VASSLRQHGTLRFLVVDFSPTGEKSTTIRIVATDLLLKCGPQGLSVVYMPHVRR
jgi:hypothetical protein